MPDRAKIEVQVKTLKEEMPGENAGRICKQISELQQTVVVLGKVAYAYDSAVATEPGGPEHPGDNGHSKPHGEDLVVGECSKM